MNDARVSLHDNRYYARATYASEAVVQLMNREGFASEDVRRMFQDRSGFIWRSHRSERGPSDEENKFVGAVLDKLARRGDPAPCSLRVESYVLKKAQDAGLLLFEKSVDNGLIKFSCRPLLKDLELMLRICFLPELLVEDGEVDLLLSRYEGHLQGSMLRKRFFEKLLTLLPDRRLAFYVVPGIMAEPFQTRTANSPENVDFVVHIPNVEGKAPLKMAIVLGENPCLSELEAEGWTAKRFDQMKPQHWDSEMRRLADQISYALPKSILEAARQLRELPAQKKQAILELKALPLAEAQLTCIMADLISRGESGEIRIGNPQNLDLAVPLQSVREMIDALSSLYGISCSIQIIQADDRQFPDIEYYSSLAAYAFSCECMASISGHHAISASARPSASSDSSARDGLKFIFNNLLRFQDFREGQAELIEQMLSLQGSIGLLKPAGGKSVACALASILQIGLALVIVPSRYAALDQQMSLAARGIHRCRAIVATDEPMPHLQDRGYDPALILLPADEALDGDCRAEISSQAINFLILDEGHGLSEWSCAFKPGYLNKVRWARINCASNLCMVALSSSRSNLVLLDIMNELNLYDPDCIVQSQPFDSRKLDFQIFKVQAENQKHVPIAALRAAMRQYGGKKRDGKAACGLVICSPEDDEQFDLAGFSQSLVSYLNVAVGVCSLKPPGKFLRLGGSKLTWQRACDKALSQFRKHELPILVCCADRAEELSLEDIRFTLHATLPASIDQFHRHISRAGQDGKPSTCMLFLSDKTLSDEPLGREMITQEFPGRVKEKRIFCQVLLKLLSLAPGSISDRKHSAISVSFLSDRSFQINGQSIGSFSYRKKLLEKALYRLMLLGAIESYERREDSFDVCIAICDASNIFSNYKNYINRFETESSGRIYLPKKEESSFKMAALQCGCKLIDYSYCKIKIEREDDLARMYRIMQAGQASPKEFPLSLHEFMLLSEMEQILDHVPKECRWQVLEGVEGRDRLLGLLLACRAKLKLQPDDAALRIVAGFCALALAFPDDERAQNDLAEGFAGLMIRNAPAHRADAARQIVRYAQSIMPSNRELILEIVWQADPSADMARLCYEKSEFASEICYCSLFRLVDGMLQSFQAVG
ncbi:MAG: DEAD/DEAH box helicase [Methanothrix sp.]